MKKQNFLTLLILFILVLLVIACENEKNNEIMIKSEFEPAQTIPYNPVGIPNNVYSIEEFGAKCDGVANDLQAFKDALHTLEDKGGGTLTLPNKKILIEGQWLPLYSNIIIKGAGENTEILFTSTNDSYTRLFNLQGSNVYIENVKLTRNSNVYGCFFVMNPNKGLTFYNCVLDGRWDKFNKVPQFDAFKMSGKEGDFLKDIYLLSTIVKRCRFGWVQDSFLKTIVDGFYVDNCTFQENDMSDLEFNAPKSENRNIHIGNSKFLNNRSRNIGRGWGIGFAKVKNATIKNNRFENYYAHAIHMEDSTHNVVVFQNIVNNCSYHDSGFQCDIIILSGTSKISIAENIFNTSCQTNRMRAVYAGPGGVGYSAPDSLTLKYNKFIFNRNDSKFIEHQANHVVESGTENVFSGTCLDY